eukprot:403371005
MMHQNDLNQSVDSSRFISDIQNTSLRVVSPDYYNIGGQSSLAQSELEPCIKASNTALIIESDFNFNDLIVEKDITENYDQIDEGFQSDKYSKAYEQQQYTGMQKQSVKYTDKEDVLLRQANEQRTKEHLASQNDDIQQSFDKINSGLGSLNLIKQQCAVLIKNKKQMQQQQNLITENSESIKEQNNQIILRNHQGQPFMQNVPSGSLNSSDCRISQSNSHMSASNDNIAFKQEASLQTVETNKLPESHQILINQTNLVNSDSQPTISANQMNFFQGISSGNIQNHQSAMYIDTTPSKQDSQELTVTNRNLNQRVQSQDLIKIHNESITSQGSFLSEQSSLYGIQSYQSKQSLYQMDKQLKNKFSEETLQYDQECDYQNLKISIAEKIPEIKALEQYDQRLSLNVQQTSSLLTELKEMSFQNPMFIGSGNNNTMQRVDFKNMKENDQDIGKSNQTYSETTFQQNRSYIQMEKVQNQNNNMQRGNQMGHDRQTFDSYKTCTIDEDQIRIISANQPENLTIQKELFPNQCEISETFDSKNNTMKRKSLKPNNQYYQNIHEKQMKPTDLINQEYALTHQQESQRSSEVAQFRSFDQFRSQSERFQQKINKDSIPLVPLYMQTDTSEQVTNQILQLEGLTFQQNIKNDDCYMACLPLQQKDFYSRKQSIQQQSQEQQQNISMSGFDLLIPDDLKLPQNPQQTSNIQQIGIKIPNQSSFHSNQVQEKLNQSSLFHGTDMNINPQNIFGVNGSGYYHQTASSQSQQNNHNEDQSMHEINRMLNFDQIKVNTNSGFKIKNQKQIQEDYSSNASNSHYNYSSNSRKPLSGQFEQNTGSNTHTSIVAANNYIHHQINDQEFQSFKVQKLQQQPNQLGLDELQNTQQSQNSNHKMRIKIGGTEKQRQNKQNPHIRVQSSHSTDTESIVTKRETIDTQKFQQSNQFQDQNHYASNEEKQILTELQTINKQLKDLQMTKQRQISGVQTAVSTNISNQIKPIQQQRLSLQNNAKHESVEDLLPQPSSPNPHPYPIKDQQKQMNAQKLLKIDLSKSPRDINQQNQTSNSQQNVPVYLRDKQQIDLIKHRMELLSDLQKQREQNFADQHYEQLMKNLKPSEQNSLENTKKHNFALNNQFQNSTQLKHMQAIKQVSIYDQSELNEDSVVLQNYQKLVTCGQVQGNFRQEENNQSDMDLFSIRINPNEQQNSQKVSHIQQLRRGFTNNRSNQSRSKSQKKVNINQKNSTFQSKKQESLENFLRRQIYWLEKKNVKIQQNRENQQEQKEINELEECTFKPQIKKLRNQDGQFHDRVYRGSSLSPNCFKDGSGRNKSLNKRCSSEDKVENRLISWDIKSKQKLQNLKKDLNREQDRVCPFKPQLTPPRLKQRQAQSQSKSQGRTTSVKKGIKNQIPNFGGQNLNENQNDNRGQTRSKSATKKKQFNVVEFYQRNLDWRNKAEKNKQSVIREIKQKEFEQNTFKPKICKMSTAIHHKKLEFLKSTDPQGDGSLYYQPKVFRDEERIQLYRQQKDDQQNSFIQSNFDQDETRIKQHEQFINQEEKLSHQTSQLDQALLDLDKEKHEFENLIIKLSQKLDYHQKINKNKDGLDLQVQNHELLQLAQQQLSNLQSPSVSDIQRSPFDKYINPNNFETGTHVQNSMHKKQISYQQNTSHLKLLIDQELHKQLDDFHEQTFSHREFNLNNCNNNNFMKFQSLNENSSQQLGDLEQFVQTSSTNEIHEQVLNIQPEQQYTSARSSSQYYTCLQNTRSFLQQNYPDLANTNKSLERIIAEAHHSLMNQMESNQINNSREATQHQQESFGVLNLNNQNKKNGSNKYDMKVISQSQQMNIKENPSTQSTKRQQQVQQIHNDENQKISQSRSISRTVGKNRSSYSLKYSDLSQSSNHDNNHQNTISYHQNNQSKINQHFKQQQNSQISQQFKENNSSLNCSSLQNSLSHQSSINNHFNGNPSKMNLFSESKKTGAFDDLKNLTLRLRKTLKNGASIDDSQQSFTENY